ncbi:MAG: rod-binding protein [Firmicutes bacterium]|jgi:flagellar protein FlgJ|nr:rod-binding protein [Bacillota bacterium]MDH7496654.1 rod-binding protein [Bacillota bacterium]
MSDLRVSGLGSDTSVLAALLRTRAGGPLGTGSGGRGSGGAAVVGASAGSRDEGTDTRADLREACEQLESVFLEQLLKEMRRTVQRDGLFGGGRGEDWFQSMFDQEISEAMARRGGIGLAEIIYRQLSRQAALPSQLGGHRPSGSGLNLSGAEESSEG